MKMRMILLFLSSITVGCVSLPDVYLIDRHTVMEEEASGQWPVLEQRIVEQGLNKGPTAFPELKDDPRKQRAFQVLNGEFVQATQE